MRFKIQVLIASLVLGVAGVSACGDDDSFGEGKLASVKLETASPLALQMPATDRRMQAQTTIAFSNDGKADLKVSEIDFSSKPERLLVAGEYLDTTCSFDADAAPTFDSSGACPESTVCWSFNGLCRKVGMPEVPFEIAPGASSSIETIIVPGTGGMNCPAAPVGDADAPANYCGELKIKTNAQNTNAPTIVDGDIRVFFTHVEGSGTIEVSPQSVSFAGVNVGSSDSRDIKITNTHSDQPLTISSIRPREFVERFTVSAAPSLPIQLAPGASETWTLGFTPSSDWDGTSFGTNLEIKSSAHNDPVKQIPVQVTSEASRPAIKLTPELLRFDGQATQTFTISNEGAASLTLRGFAVLPSTTQAMYTIKENGNEIVGQYTKVLGAGETQDYEITFAPGSDPGGIGTLEVLYNYFVNEQSQNDMAQIELLGDVGDAPIGQISPDVFTFRAAAGENVTRSFVMRNVGTQPLVASGVAITDVIPNSAATFSTSMTNGTTIAPGDMQTFTVTYQGDDESDDRAALYFGTNTAGEEMFISLIALSGAASTAEAVVTPSFGDDAVPVNTEARFNALLSTGFADTTINRAQWTLLERPAGSQTFIDKIGPDATIFPDTAGQYKIALTLTEGNASSQTVYQFSAQ
ncbi:choice-of-anchor D domain-containing protein [Bradymonas sediminis]|uniref:HYDIN/VesB/CFA65-like Ig-like domain-containing protein n=1 Tax=Bradymonas sediminis TaxID=1548548 RepID=A0A2Z4FNN0_9DELT|nr:choice-of-anchor D domain-containing protein [Bradymonas sediminis]AWV90470.1 hypothetical protein DN745_14485 [Bradymonas sediminis]TDP72142.1 hypothetical protein DFR33_107124 [Bradymonas sediminis]